jgi:hypothetical protein
MYMPDMSKINNLGGYVKDAAKLTISSVGLFAAACSDGGVIDSAECGRGYYQGPNTSFFSLQIKGNIDVNDAVYTRVQKVAEEHGFETDRYGHLFHFRMEEGEITEVVFHETIEDVCEEVFKGA